MKKAHKNMRGFEYLLYSGFSCVLLLVLTLLPLAPVFADEEVIEEVVATESVPSITDTVAEESSPLALEEVIVTEPVVENDTEILSTETQTDEAEVLAATSFEQTETAESPAEDVAVDSPEEVLEESPSDLILEETTDMDEETAEIPLSETGDITDLEPESGAEDIDLDAASEVSDEEVVSNVIVANTVTTDENRYSFSKSECTVVRDGAFYCAESNETATVLHTDRIFAAPDSDGDKEIFIEEGGEVTQITFNLFDDDAPKFDERSNTLVWHRLIDGRYQIMSYSFDDMEETQVTFDRYNNMEPNRYGGSTVWQGWVGNDWEIFHLVGDELTMLTDNTSHDITPRINDTHIIWQAFENNVWMMKVYDIRTGSIETIAGTDGGSIENPRFVLVYDTKYETGDVETRGYDLESGQVITLGAEPVSLPDEIPDPEQTGEDRALVQSQTQPKSKSDLDEDEDDTILPPLDDGEGDLVIPPLETASTTDDTPSITDTIQGEDLIVLPHTDAETSNVEHIIDVVVTPYVEDIASESDSQ